MIGSLNYGGGSNGSTWNGRNIARLFTECSDITEIAVHANANRIASLMYYEGGGTNKLTIGRNMGWDTLSIVVMNGTDSCIDSLCIGQNDGYPGIRLGSTNGNNIGIATTATSFSNSSNVNYMVVMVVKSLNHLILQSGGGGYGVLIDTNNYITFNKLLLLNIDQVDRPTVENRIITNGAISSGVFAGDQF
jgi:hypothetical protein